MMHQDDGTTQVEVSNTVVMNLWDKSFCSYHKSCVVKTHSFKLNGLTPAIMFRGYNTVLRHISDKETIFSVACQDLNYGYKKPGKR